MRPIDADEVKKQFPIMENDFGMVINETLHKELDKIPTLEVIPKAYLIDVLNNIRLEITTCLQALDEIEKSGLNIYLPNEISGRRLTYQQCLEFIDKYFEFIDKYKIKVE